MSTETEQDNEVLYLKHRPMTFKQVIGQTEAVSQLQTMLKKNKVPKAILFTGASGCGKTTLARILMGKLDCRGSDLFEMDAAKFRGIDSIRDISNRMRLKPMNGKNRGWILDEVHRLTTDAQSGLLKPLEDTPKHVHFMLCTTDPQKVLAAIKTRCTVINVKPLGFADTAKLITQVSADEGKPLDDEVIEKLATHAEGSARKALVLLHQIIDLPNTEKQLAGIEAAEAEKAGIDIARALLNVRTTWRDMAKVLREVTDDPEAIRHIVMGYASAVLIGKNSCGNEKLCKRAYTMLDAFRVNFYDSKKNGLIAACREVICGD